MLHGLGSQVIEQVGVVIVRNVVEVHQAADHVVFQTSLLDASPAQGNDLQVIRAQVLNP